MHVLTHSDRIDQVVINRPFKYITSNNGNLPSRRITFIAKNNEYRPRPKTDHLLSKFSTFEFLKALIEVKLHVSHLLSVIEKILENYPALIYCVKANPTINQSQAIGAGAGRHDFSKYDDPLRGSSVLLKVFNRTV